MPEAITSGTGDGVIGTRREHSRALLGDEVTASDHEQ
jgi:hypothetical protein